MDCSPPGSSVHGILHTRILEWVTMPSSRGPSWPRDWTQVSRITGRFFTIWATSDNWAPEQGGSGEEIPAHFSHLLWQNQKPASEDAHSGTFLKGQLLGLRTHGGDPAGQCWSSSCLVLEDFKEIPQVQGQRSPSKTAGGAKLFRIKPHTRQRHSEVSNKPCGHQETPQRRSQNSVSVSPAEAWVSSGLLQEAGALGTVDLVWHKPSWRKALLIPPMSHQNLHRTGETDSWRAQTKAYVHRDPGESDPTRDWPDLPVSRRPCGKRGSVVACCRVGGTACSSTSRGPFEGSYHYLHYLHHSLASGQITDREHSSVHQLKIEWKIYWHGLTHQNKTQFPPQSVSLPGSFHKPLIHLHQRAHRLKTTNIEN